MTNSLETLLTELETARKNATPGEWGSVDGDPYYSSLCASRILRLIEIIRMQNEALNKAASHKMDSVDKTYLLAQCDGYQLLAKQTLEQVEKIAKGE
jgi:hypothetical protein